MQGGRAATAAQDFTAEAGHLRGYEGGRSGQRHPEHSDPDQRVAKWSQVHPTSRVENQKVAKVNSYGSFGLGVEFGTWR